MARKLDQELLAGFIEESKEYVPKILEGIETLGEAPNLLDAAEEPYRCVHIIKGAASMLGLSVLSHVSYFVEETLEAIKKGKLAADQKSLSFLKEGVREMETCIDDLIWTRAADRSVLSGLRKSFQYLGVISALEDEMFLSDSADELDAELQEDITTETEEKKAEIGHTDVIGWDGDEINIELKELFIMEAKEHIENVSHLLSGLATSPGNDEHLESVRRSIHTLKGAAGMVGFQSVFQLAYRMEELLDRVCAGAVEASPDVMVLLFSTSDALESLVAGKGDRQRLDNTVEDLHWRYYDLLSGFPITDDLSLEALEEKAAELAAGSAQNVFEDMILLSDETENAESDDRTPTPDGESIEPEAIPPELLEVFLIEANEHLQNVSRSLTEFRKDPARMDQLQEIRRSIHTLKGAAGMVGFVSVSQLSHRMEDLLDKLYDRSLGLSQNMINLLFKTSDALEDLVSGNIGQKGLEETVQTLYGQYTELLHGIETPAVPEPAAPAGAKIEPVEQGTIPQLVRSGLTGLDKAHEFREIGRMGTHPGQFVRVPIERLDELVNLVSELIVNRSAFEQHFGRFIEEVDELQPSVERLKRVSAKLETQFEVMALGGGRFISFGMPAAGASRSGAYFISNQGASDSGGSFDRLPERGVFKAYDFDELEFDRYTEFHIFSRELTESTGDLSTVGNELRDIIGDFDSHLDRHGRLVSEIQDKLMRLRMVPLSTLSTRLHRSVRNTAAEEGKIAELVIEGENVELDKTVLEEMADPLLHILRNAVDHGIEFPEIRRAIEKSENGRITISAYYEGTQVVIRVSDDGSGLDTYAIVAAAMRSGFISEVDSRKLTDEEINSLIFLPGFSTARKVSEVSGRGMGMDIVRSAVNRLKGTITVSSKPGLGVTFTIRLPMTLAIARVLVVKAGKEKFAVPLAAVAQILRIEKDEIERVGQKPVIRAEGKVYPVVRLSSALNLGENPERADTKLPALILNLGEKSIALVVDAILEAREIVVKGLGNHLRRVPAVAGATIMGDGSVLLILNPNDLFKELSARETRTASSVLPRAHQEYGGGGLDVLVVDDSVSVRRILSNLIKSAGWNPIVAKDGVEALEVIGHNAKNPDVILLDIEMPRMDGYELLSTLRSHVSYRDVPVVMITSRSGPKHKQRAFELGADEYLVKPYQDDVLIGLIRKLSAGRMGRILQ